jgi:hypothetical protein
VAPVLVAEPARDPAVWTEYQNGSQAPHTEQQTSHSHVQKTSQVLTKKRSRNSVRQRETSETAEMFKRTRNGAQRAAPRGAAQLYTHERLPKVRS